MLRIIATDTDGNGYTGGPRYTQGSFPPGWSTIEYTETYSISATEHVPTEFNPSHYWTVSWSWTYLAKALHYGTDLYFDFVDVFAADSGSYRTDYDPYPLDPITGYADPFPSMASDTFLYTGSTVRDVFTFGSQIPHWYTEAMSAGGTAYGYGGDDEFSGNVGSDVFYGGQGHDRLFGGGGADQLYGDEGNDLVYLESGSDYADGGADEDEVWIYRDLSDLSFNLTFDPRSDDLITLADGSRFRDFESLQASFGSGNDTVTILYGSDLSRSHSVSLGDGTDSLILDVSEATIDVRFYYDYRSMVYRLISSAGFSSFQTFERLEIRGGSGSDDLVGDAGNDTLFGNGGDDSLGAGLGHDVVYGGAGNDFISNGDHSAFMDGGDGDDYLYLYRMTSATSYAFTFDQRSDAVVTLVDGTEFSNFEFADIRLGSGNDTVTVVLDERLTGYQPFLNVAYLGAGNDTVIFDASNLISALGVGNYGGVVVGSNYLWDIGEVEHIDFRGGAANDTFNGTDGSDTLAGNRGDDWLNGLMGHDSIFGGIGDDILWSIDLDSDTLNGGAGNDQLILDRGASSANFAFTFNPMSNAASRLVDGTSFADFERLYATLGSGDDRVTLVLGPTAHLGQTVTFGGGSDRAILDLTAFTDNLYGGLDRGTGIVRTTTWGDALVGLSEVETLDVRFGAGNDGFYSGAGRDTLSGNGGDDVLDGGAGFDVILGGDGRDTIYSLGDADSVVGGADDDTLVLDRSGSTANFTMTFDPNSDAALRLVDGTRIADFELLRADFGAGNDKITVVLSSAQTGEQVVNFGTGVDRAVIDLTDISVGLDVVFELSSLAASAFLRGGPRLFYGVGAESIEVRGGAGSDAIFGGGIADLMYGNAGNDTVDGGAGADLIYGGLGLDSLTGGDGRDLIDGGANSDTLVGGVGNDTLIGGGGRDTLTGGLGFDVFVFNVAPTNPTSDVITDFNPFFDSIQLASTAFVGLTVGALDAAAFTANLSGAATDALQRIIYETDTGRLFFDPDGDGAGARIQVATLGTGLSLGAVDFSVA